MIQNNQCSVLGTTAEQTQSWVVIFFISGHQFTFGIGIHESAVGAFKEDVEGIAYIQTLVVSFYKTENNLLACTMYDRYEIIITTPTFYNVNFFSLPNCKHFLDVIF
jgi:hypothetical protein